MTWQGRLEWFSNPRFQRVFIILLVAIVYGNTLWNKYALDDAIVLTENKFVQRGISGIADIFRYDSFTGFFGEQKNLVAGGRYRPLSIATFAVEQSLWGQNPALSHAINVLLFACLCVLLQKVLQQLAGGIGQSIAPAWSFLVAVLFAVHPVNTEVVANIKGRDEILSLLFALLAWYTLPATDSSKTGWKWVIPSGCFFLALLSKETAIVFFVIIPLAVWLVTRNLKSTLRPLVLLACPLLAFAMLRWEVLGGATLSVPDELMNNPYLYATDEQKMATIAYVVVQYFRLLVFPHPLTYDYYPYHIALKSFSQPAVWIGIVLTVLLVLTVLVLLRRKHYFALPLIIILLPLALVSNLFFPTGTFMNERFLFVPVIGYGMILAWLLTGINRRRHFARALVVISGLLFVLYSLKTISRNWVWHDDFTLFTTDVAVSSQSAKANTTAGGAWYERSIAEKDSLRRVDGLRKSKSYLDKALEIYPTYIDALLLRANVEWERTQSPAKAFEYYRKVLERNPGHSTVSKNVLLIASGGAPAPERAAMLEGFLGYQRNHAGALHRLGSIYGRELGNLPMAVSYLQRAVIVNPADVNCLKDLGVALAMSGRSDDALGPFKQAAAITPDDASLCLNIALALSQSGKSDEASQWFARAFALDPSLKR